MRNALFLENCYNKYYKSVFYTALGFLKTIENAEDASQAVFEKFINHEGQIENAGGWLIACTKNYCKNYIRDNAKNMDVDEISPYTPSAESLPSEIVEENHFISRVLTCLAGDEKEIFVLHILSGLKHREIADILQLPAATVRWKYADAVKKLKIYLKEYSK